MASPLEKQRVFRYWCQKILPAVYDDSLSYYELLNKVVQYLNDVISKYNEMVDAVNTNTEDIALLKEAVSDLEAELEKVKKGDYVSLYLESIINWIDNNLQCLVSRIVKFVCFGLTQDGYFCAYIPQTWKFLNFDTGMNYSDKQTYGHLIIEW